MRTTVLWIVGLRVYEVVRRSEVKFLDTILSSESQRYLWYIQRCLPGSPSHARK